MTASYPETRKEILKQTIPLFAKKGYNGLTMREISSRTGITTGAIYHHFSGKQDLYVSAMKLAFAGRMKVVTESIRDDCSPWICLEKLVFRFCEELSTNPVFTRLIQWEILDGDEKRLRMVVETVFGDVFSSLSGLCYKLSPANDAFLLAESIVALCAYHYQFAPIRAFLPGNQPDRDNNPATIARHILLILKNGIGLGKKPMETP